MPNYRRLGPDGKFYSFIIAGDTPTASENAKIEQHLFKSEAPVKEEAPGSTTLSDYVQAGRAGIGDAAAAAGFLTGEQSWSDWGQRQRDEAAKNMSKAATQAQAEGVWGGGGIAALGLGASRATPAMVGTAIATGAGLRFAPKQSMKVVGEAALEKIPGMATIAGRLATKEGIPAAEAAAKLISGALAGAGSEGLISAGMSGDDAKRAVMLMAEESPDEFRTSPVGSKYLALYGGDYNKAAKAAADEVSRDIAIKVGLTSGLMALPGAGIEAAILGRGLRGGIGGAFQGAGVGATQEGIEEFGQSATEQIYQNLASQKIGRDIPTLDGALRAGAEGAAIGSVMGGVMGGVGGGLTSRLDSYNERMKDLEEWQNAQQSNKPAILSGNDESSPAEMEPNGQLPVGLGRSDIGPYGSGVDGLARPSQADLKPIVGTQLSGERLFNSPTPTRVSVSELGVQYPAPAKAGQESTVLASSNGVVKGSFAERGKPNVRVGEMAPRGPLYSGPIGSLPLDGTGPSYPVGTKPDIDGLGGDLGGPIITGNDSIATPTWSVPATLGEYLSARNIESDTKISGAASASMQPLPYSDPKISISTLAKPTGSLATEPRAGKIKVKPGAIKGGDGIPLSKGFMSGGKPIFQDGDGWRQVEGDEIGKYVQLVGESPVASEASASPPSSLIFMDPREAEYAARYPLAIEGNVARPADLSGAPIPLMSGLPFTKEPELGKVPVEIKDNIAKPLSPITQTWEAQAPIQQVQKQAPAKDQSIPEAKISEEDLSRLRENLQKKISSLGIPEAIVEVVGDTQISSASLLENKPIIKLAMAGGKLNSAEMLDYLSGVMDHEAIHALFSLGIFTKKEQAQMLRFARSAQYVSMTGVKQKFTWQEWADFTYRPIYEGKVEDVEAAIGEEAIAEAFRVWAKDKSAAPGMMNSFFSRIVQFFTKVKEAIFESGAESTFRKIIDGEMADRPRKPEDRGERFSLPNDPENPILIIHGGSDFDMPDLKYSGRGEPGNIRPLGPGLYGFSLMSENKDEIKKAIEYAAHYSNKYGRGNKTLHVFKVKKAPSSSNGPVVEGFEPSGELKAALDLFGVAEKLPAGEERSKAYDRAQAALKAAPPPKIRVERLPSGLVEVSVLDAGLLERVGKYPVGEESESIISDIKSKERTRFSLPTLYNIGQRALPSPVSGQQRVLDMSYAAAYDSIYNILNKGYKASRIWKLSDNLPMELPSEPVYDAFKKFQARSVPLARFLDEVRRSGGYIEDALNPMISWHLMRDKINQDNAKSRESILEPAIERLNSMPFTKADRDNLIKFANTMDKNLGDQIRDMIGVGNDLNIRMTLLYGVARHAQERNAYLRKKWGDEFDPQKNGAGLTDDEAKNLLSYFSSNFDINKLNNAIQGAYDINAETNRVNVEGLLTPDFNAHPSTTHFKYYLPLVGRGDIDNSTQGIFDQSLSTGGREYKRMYGRESLPTNVLEELVRRLHISINRANHNKMMNDFIDMVGQNESVPGFDTLAKVVEELPTAKAVRGEGFGTVRLPVEADPLIVYAKNIKKDENGNDQSYLRMVKFAPQYQGLANFLNGKDAQKPGDANFIFRWMLAYNRFLGSLLTRLNPEFMLSNLPRDIFTAYFNSMQYQGVDNNKVAKDAIAAVKSIWKAERNPSYSDPYADLYKRAASQGALTTDYGLNDPFESIKSIVKNITDPPKQARKVINSVGKYISDMNAAFENASRVAIMKNMLEAGYSERAALNAAKTITINFDEGGTLRNSMNAMYLFYNASIQGTFGIFMAAARSPKLQKTMVGIAFTGAIMDFINRAMSPEDDQGNNLYDQIQDYVKEHNLIIMNPAGNGYLKIPLPYGYHAIYNLGRVTYAAGSGNEPIGKAIGSVTNSFVEGFVPLGGAANWLNYVAPTVLDPWVDLYTNETFSGQKVWPEGSGFGPQDPKSQLYWNNTPSAYNLISELLRIPGTGTDKLPGMGLEVSPNEIQHVVESMTGALMPMAGRIWSLTENIATGNVGVLEANDVPLARKVLGSVGDRTQKQRFYELRDKYDLFIAEINDAKKDGEIDRIRYQREHHPDMWANMSRYKALNNRRNKLLKAARDLESNSRIPDEAKEERVKRLKEAADSLALQIISLEK